MEPRNRSIEHRHEYADKWFRSESAYLMAHGGQVLRTRAMFLEPLLVFGRCSSLPTRRLQLLNFSPKSLSRFFQKPIRREQYLTHPAFRGFAQAPPFFFQQRQFAPVSFQFK